MRALFGSGVSDLRAGRRELTVGRFASGEQFRRFFAAYHGPTIAAYRDVADDPARTAELDAAIDAPADAHGAGTGVMRWGCLQVVATVA